MTHCCKLGSLPSSRSTTGISLRPCKTAAAGPAGRRSRAFAADADVVARRLGDRVAHWITHNELWVVAFLGHAFDIHARGLQDVATALLVSHHLLVSHGLAAQAIQGAVQRPPVGITLTLSAVRPASAAETDQLAAQRDDGVLNRWLLDPLFARGYPPDMLQVYGERIPAITPGDLNMGAQPLDFLGVNYDTPAFVRHHPGRTDLLDLALFCPAELQAVGYETTEMGWAIVPVGLAELLARLERDYAPPTLYITENGAAFDDHLVDPEVHDPRRIAFLQDHIAVASQTIQAGVPFRGDFVWSLLDNFEWAQGYSKRFALVHTDYETLERIPEDSSRWYSQVVQSNRLGEPEESALP